MPKWLPHLFVLFGLALVPWILWLVASLPGRAVANHWQIAWAGFDVALASSLAGTGIAMLRRSALSGMLASTSATLLVADAWFDVITAGGSATFTLALVEAICCELPIALLCFWIAGSIAPVRERRIGSASRPISLRGIRLTLWR